MTKVIYRITQGILGMLLVGYCLAAFLHIGAAADILAPVLVGSAGICIVHYFRKAPRARAALFFIAAYFLSWAMTDTLWAWYDLALGIAPENLDLFMYLYILPNLFLAMAVIAFLADQLKHLNRAQYLLDLTLNVIMGISFIWVLFYRDSGADRLVFNAENISSFLYIAFDAIAVCGLFVWFVATRTRHLPLPIWITAAGIVLFGIFDMTYIYQIFHKEYIPNTLVDILYIVSFAIIAKGLLQGARNQKLAEERIAAGQVAVVPALPDPGGVGGRAGYTISRKALLLLLVPVLIGLIHGFDMRVLLYMNGLVVVHQLISSFLQSSGHKRRLLLQEMHNNELLEERIAQRTRELMDVNARLETLSRQDPVTGLNNRRFFLDTLEQLLASAGPDDRIALYFMDLDRFKAVNDSHGHDVGDQLLIEVGRRLLSVHTPGSMLARLGGDEFVLAIKGPYGRDYFEPIAWQLISLFQTPIQVRALQFQISISIGITIFPLDCAGCSALLRNADIAMYQAKATGLNQYVFFSALLNENIQRENRLELLLRKAKLKEEFSLHYQPQFSFYDGSLVGAEALLRWNSPDIGSVSPGEFIPVAEANGLIVPLGEWVLRQALRQARIWNEDSASPIRIGVNLSPRQLAHPGFAQALGRVLDTTGVDPAWLDLKITEHSAMQSGDQYRELFQTITAAGTTLSIDDFGTGYSSLSYLEKYPIHRLKIARELVEKINADEGSCQIVKAIIALANAMDIRKIAEGVETVDQRDILIRLGCEQAQGFLYCRPLPAEEFARRYLACAAAAMNAVLT